ncbi:hypothetical protein JYU10_00885 [bacterium AH-315-J04]|nr:hypothetical protein [bacterium AH-315-J04]
MKFHVAFCTFVGFNPSFSGTDLLKLAIVVQKAYENAAAIREQAEISEERA